jgi:hypothetical protein
MYFKQKLSSLNAVSPFIGFSALYMYSCIENTLRFPILKRLFANANNQGKNGVSKASSRAKSKMSKVRSKSKVTNFKKGKKNSSMKTDSSKEQRRKGTTKVPTAGYIGKTRFDLIPLIFLDLVPSFINEGHNIQDLLDQTVKVHDEIIYHHGVIEGTRKWKAITLYATGLLEGRKPDNPGWVAVGKVNKWPKKIRHLLPMYIFVKDNIHNKEMEHEIAEMRRLILTLFKLNRVCKGSTELESHLLTIRSRFKLDPELLAEFEQFARIKLADVRDRITLTDLSFDLFLGPSNGPNGKPKLESAYGEAAILKKDTKLYTAFKELTIITDNKYFLDFFELCSKKVEKMDSSLSSIKLRKLMAIPDKANKSRVIAICDFWTQSILASIESKVLNITRELFPRNCAYDSHSEGWKNILSQPQEIQDQLVSLDASSWTDNFPAALQFITVKALFGQRLASAWKALVVDCLWYIPNYATPIRFGKGQGMGTKGSFAIAQLTDLLYILFIFNKYYPEMKDPYFMKVGDDLSIQDPNRIFQLEYEKIGVPINLSKSKFKTDFGTFNEFVSRNSWNNLDYSIISPSLVSKFLRNDYYAVILYKHINERMTDTTISFSELLAKKQIVLKSKENFSLDKYMARKASLLKLVSVMNLVDPDPVLLDQNDIWDPTKEEILLLLENMVLLTLGRLALQTEYLLFEPEIVAHRKQVSDLRDEFRISKQLDLMNHENGTKSFYKYAVQNELTFKEAVILRLAMPILESKEEAFQKGYDKVLTNSVEIFEPFTEPQNGCVTVNPDFVAHMVQLWVKLEDASQGYKTLRRGPKFEKLVKRKTIIKLFDNLNSIIHRESRILDMNTYLMELPNKKGQSSVRVESTLVDDFARVLRFDAMLESISNLRHGNTFVKLYPPNSKNGEVDD